jgi:arylsulfatase A-like enzyme
MRKVARPRGQAPTGGHRQPPRHSARCAARTPSLFLVTPPAPPGAAILTPSPFPLLPLLSALACGTPAPTPPRTTAIAAAGTQPDLLLFLAPGLRADFPGQPGAEAAFLAPLQDRLDARFSAAYTASPSPWVGLGTLLTGRYPAAVPLCGLPRLGPRAAEGAPWCATLPAEVPTLPEVLAIYGYQTALVGFHLEGQALIAGRFGAAYDLDPAWEHPTTPWDTLARDLPTWWEAHAETPRLAVVVVSDLLYPERNDLRWELGLGTWTGETPEGWARTAGTHEQAMARYQAEAGAIGGHLADLLAAIEGAAPPRPLVALASSTNGMSLGELEGKISQKDFFFSDSLVLERTIHVPLVLLGAPGAGAPADIPDLVEAVDILPTLCALAGAVPPASLAGGSLLAPDDDGTAYAELGDMIALRKGSLMLTFRLPRHNTCSLDPQFERALEAPDHQSRLILHDVCADPLQLSEPPPGRRRPPEEVEALYQALLTLRRGKAAPVPGALTADRVRQLHLTAAQGYW